jgi:FkbM family methyltransferase
MLLDIELLSSRYHIRPNGVIHVGAHKGEEKDTYSRLSWSPIYWIEAQSNLAENLRASLLGSDDKVFNAAIWNESNLELNLNITNNGESTSLLELGSHKENYRIIDVIKKERVKTIRLDELLVEETVFDFLNLDIQGVELRALQSLGSRIADVKYIYIEVNREEVYLGCAKVQEIDKYLNSSGFRRVATRWVLGKGWGDAFYIRNAPESLLIEKIINFCKETKAWYLPQFKDYLIEKIKKNIPKQIFLILKKIKVNRGRKNQH